MLCCRKRPPSPNEKHPKKSGNSQGTSPANCKASATPKTEQAHTNGVAKPEAVVLEERLLGSGSRKSSSPKSPQRNSPSPQKVSPTKSRSASPQKESSPRKSKSPSPKKTSPPKSKSPSPKKTSPPKSKSPSPQKERSPDIHSPSQGLSPGEKSEVTSPLSSPDVDRLPGTALADFLKRIEATADPEELLDHGRRLLSEAMDRKAEGGLEPKMSRELTNLMTRLEAVTSRLELTVNNTGGGAGDGAAVLAYDDQVAEHFAVFMQKCGQIGGVVNEQAEMVKAAFSEQRAIIVKASKAKQPDQGGLQAVLAPLSQKIQEIQEFRERNRVNKEFFNHLSMISEAIGALGWVAVSPTPAPYIKEMSDAGQFYSNRVLKDYKEKDKTHVEWVRAWSKTLAELQSYVKKTHTTGLSWNKQGVDVSTLGGAPPPAAAGPPPPPPPGPPPPPCDFSANPAPSNDANEARNDLFASLNKGADITSNLRKVKDDQKMHKNAALRLQAPVPYKATSHSAKATSKPFSAPKVTKPPKIELDGKKWIIEYHKDNKNIVLDDVSMKQLVYIFKCENSTIQVKGKVNSIVLDSCKKTAIVFDNVVAALEAINCQSIQAQLLGTVPTVSIDKTDGFQLYLNKNSLNTEIVTAKSSEMNILVPQADGEFKEYALPEQYKSMWGGKGFKTTTTEINS